MEANFCILALGMERCSLIFLWHQFKHSKEGIKSVNHLDDGSNKEEINTGVGLDKSKYMHRDNVNATNGDESKKDNTYDDPEF